MRAVVLALVLAACGTDGHAGAGIDVERERHFAYPCSTNGGVEGDRMPSGSVFVSALLCEAGADAADCEDITGESYVTEDRRIHSECKDGLTLRWTWLEPDPPLDTGAFE